MKVNTVNISFNSDLLVQIDKVAQDESRSRSELIREAARMYVERKKRWQSIFSYTAKQVKALGLKQQDVAKAIQDHRKKK